RGRQALRSGRARVVDALLALVRTTQPLAPPEAEQIVQAWGEPRDVARGEILLRPGAVCRSLWFLDEGYARFYAEREGEDVTRHFAPPGALFTIVASLYSGRPSREGLQMLTPGRVREVPREAYERLAETNAPWDAFRTAYVREVYDYLDRALDDARSLTAAERYAAFERDQPEVLLHVPLRYVASYLGMTPQSLSRIRAR
ncbi:MAG: Crp/Fnr family transcriptional regulator, partial [Bacteroidota bacterium]